MNEKGIDWKFLGLGILYVIVSLLSFKNPLANLITIVAIYAVFAIMKGIFEILVRNRVKKLTGYKEYAPLIFGAINIIVGVYLLFNINVGVAIAPFVFAIWFISDSISGLFMLDVAKLVGNGYYWFTLIVNVLGIILGIMLLFDPITSALSLSFLIGFYFMMFGINNIFYAFRYKF